MSGLRSHLADWPLSMLLAMSYEFSWYLTMCIGVLVMGNADLLKYAKYGCYNLGFSNLILVLALVFPLMSILAIHSVFYVGLQLEDEPMD